MCPKPEADVNGIDSRPNLKTLGLKSYKELVGLPRLAWISCAWGLSLRHKLEFKDTDGKGVKCGLMKDRGYEKKGLPDRITNIDVYVADTCIEQITFIGKTTLVAGAAKEGAEIKQFRIPEGEEFLGVVLHYDSKFMTCGVTWLTWLRPK